MNTLTMPTWVISGLDNYRVTIAREFPSIGARLRGCYGTGIKQPCRRRQGWDDNWLEIRKDRNTAPKTYSRAVFAIVAIR
jgi:hypothetical protein